MLVRRETYEEMRKAFAWDIPQRFNIADAICDRHLGLAREALIYERPDGSVDRYSFERLQQLSRRLANALAAKGVAREDRVGILLPQCPETLLAHLALYRLGAVALPLFTLFGPEALEYRLNDSGARAVVTNDVGVEKLMMIRDRVDGLRFIVNVEAERAAGVVGFSELVERAAAAHTIADTAAEDAAIWGAYQGPQDATINPQVAMAPRRGDKCCVSPPRLQISHRAVMTLFPFE
jgi:acetyl-CoA synthetase